MCCVNADSVRSTFPSEQKAMHKGRGIHISERNRLYLNLGNLVFFLIVAFTGLVIQIRYHMHAAPDVYLTMGFDKARWVLLHQTSAVVFFAGLVVHCLANRQFVATGTRRIMSGILKPFLSQSYWLFLISVPACLTALSSWLFFGGSEQARVALIETHDKLGWLLVIFGLIHIVSRSGRMIKSCRKTKKKVGT